MKRARFPIAGLMAAVVAVAINLAVMRVDRRVQNVASLVAPVLCLRRHADGKPPDPGCARSRPRTWCGGAGSRHSSLVSRPWVGRWSSRSSPAIPIAPSVLLGYTELIGTYTRPVFESLPCGFSGLGLGCSSS